MPLVKMLALLAFLLFLASVLRLFSFLNASRSCIIVIWNSQEAIQTKLRSCNEQPGMNCIVSLALPARPLFTYNPVQNPRKLLTRWPIWNDLLSNLLSHFVHHGTS